MTRPRHQDWLLAGFIMLATLAAYSPILGPEARLLWAEHSGVWHTRGHLDHDLARDAGGDESSDPVLSLESPLSQAILALEWKLLGAEDLWTSAPDRARSVEEVERIARRFHVINILLHALCAIVAALALARLGVPASPWIGLAFALAPLNVPTIATVSALPSVLSLAMMLLSLLLFLGYAERRKSALYIASLACFTLSLDGGSAATSLPFLLLGALWWQERTLSGRELALTAPYFALSLAVIALAVLGRSLEYSGVDASALRPGFESAWRSMGAAGHLRPIGLIAALALVIGALAHFVAQRPRARVAAGLAGACILLVLGGMTWERARTFETHISLWSESLRLAPDASKARYELGSALLLEAGHMQPGDARTGVTAWAARHLDRATELEPENLRARYLLGHALAGTGEDAGAVDAWRSALERDQAQRMIEKEEEAARRTEIAQAERRLGRHREALAELERAIELRPGDPQVHFEYSRVLLRLGDERTARHEFERVLEIDGEHFRARISLATLLAMAFDPRVRDGDAALEHALVAERIAPPTRKARLNVLFALGAAHAERGMSGWNDPKAEFDAARNFMRGAMQIALEIDNIRQFEAGAARYKKYSTGRAVRRKRTW